MNIAGYTALRDSAAVVDLAGRGWIRTTGEDRARLLHALSTNHVQQMRPGQSCYAFFLTAQGRIIADAYLHCRPDAFLVETGADLRANLYAHIDKYIIADDVSLFDASQEIHAFSIEGPASSSAVESLGLAPLPEPDYHAPFRGGLVLRGGVTGTDGFRFAVTPAVHDEVLNLLELPQAGPEEAEVVRLENARPAAPTDITPQSLAHETQLMHAMHFSKGCYLGQEIVERVRSRGHVNRLLVQLECEGEQVPAAGTPVLQNGAEAGQITSAAYSPALKHVAALAYVRAASAAAGTQLEVLNRRANVTGSPR